MSTTIEELLKEIGKEKEKLFDQVNAQASKEVTFFHDFLATIQKNFLKNITEIDYYDFIIAYVSANSKKLSFDEVYSIITKIKKVYSKKDFNKFVELSRLIDICTIRSYHNKQKNSLLEYLSLALNKEMKQLTNILCSIKETYHIDLSSYVELYAKEQYEFCNAFSLISAFSIASMINQSYEEEKEKYSDLLKKQYVKKEMKKELNSKITSSLKTEEIAEELEKIKRYAEKLISKEKNRKRKLKKELNNYMYIETWLKKEANKQKEEITSVPKEITLIELRILTLIHEHNMKGYKKMNSTYQTLLSNSYNKYNLLLEKYHISLVEHSVDITRDIHESEKILETITSIGIHDVEQLVYILNHSSIEIVSRIKNLFLDGYISSEFLLKNESIFYDHYLDFITNLEYFKSENISISNIQKLEKLLIENPKIVEKNMNVLKEYDLDSYLIKANQLDFMCNEDLASKIDNLLELGLESFLEEDLNLLNQDEESLKQIIILKRLNIPIEDINQLYTILNHQSSIISKDSIHQYIFDINIYEQPEIPYKTSTKDEFLRLLERYHHSTRTYCLNGLFISKNKVKHFLSKIDREKLSGKEQLDCIIANMILDKEELENITSCLFERANSYKI